MLLIAKPILNHTQTNKVLTPPNSITEWEKCYDARTFLLLQPNWLRGISDGKRF